MNSFPKFVNVRDDTKRKLAGYSPCEITTGHQSSSCSGVTQPSNGLKKGGLEGGIAFGNPFGSNFEGDFSLQHSMEVRSRTSASRPDLTWTN